MTTAEPVYSDLAHFDGADHPRCQATPAKRDTKAGDDLSRGRWGCALPTGHELFGDPRHHPHSWTRLA